MATRPPFQVDPRWSFEEFLAELFAHYRGIGVESTGRRLNAIRTWLSMSGKTRAVEELRLLEERAEGASAAELAESLWMSESSYKTLKRWVQSLPDEPTTEPKKVFISYKWESGDHVAWVRKLAADLRGNGINAMLDQWEVKFGESFTDYMQRHIADADVILFVISPGAIAAAEAPQGEGGALKFEVQMMNARRMQEGVRIIGVYRSGDRPPHYLRDHRYADFRVDADYEQSLKALLDDLQNDSAAPPVVGNNTLRPARGQTHESLPPNATGAARPPLARDKLQQLLAQGPSKDFEVTNGLWLYAGNHAKPRRTGPHGPIRARHVDDDTFELVIPHGSLWSLRVPYSLLLAVWTTTDGKVALRLDGRAVLHNDGFHLEAIDA